MGEKNNHIIHVDIVEIPDDTKGVPLDQFIMNKLETNNPVNWYELIGEDAFDHIISNTRRFS